MLTGHISGQPEVKMGITDKTVQTHGVTCNPQCPLL